MTELDAAANAFKLVQVIDAMAEARGINPVSRAGELLTQFDGYTAWQWAACARIAGLRRLEIETIHRVRGVYLHRHRRQKR